MKPSNDPGDPGLDRPSPGRLFIVSAPSGAGKSTLCDAARRRIPSLQYSISYTTRSPREGEEDGVDYHFVTEDAFREGIENNRWAEWAEVHGHYYGTDADAIDAARAEGFDILMDIDVQGALQMARRYPDCVTIFIAPPSMDVLRERLCRRGTEDACTIDRRIQNAEWEMDQRGRYDHVIVNDRLSDAVDRLCAVIAAHRPAQRRGGSGA